MSGAHSRLRGWLCVLFCLGVAGAAFAEDAGPEPDGGAAGGSPPRR